MRFRISVAACLALSACATVPPGQAGIVLGHDGVAPRPLAEGVSFIGPLAAVELYDLREEQRREDMVALSADGMMLEADASVLTFRPVPSELVQLAREVGPDYYDVL